MARFILPGMPSLGIPVREIGHGRNATPMVFFCSEGGFIVIVTIGGYQISVQRCPRDPWALARQEARRLQLEREVEAERERTLHLYREWSGQIR